MLRLKKRRFHNDEEEAIATCEWLRMEGTNFNRDGIFQLFPKCEECTTCLKYFVRSYHRVLQRERVLNWEVLATVRTVRVGRLFFI